ncbi:PotD/PotF family extracellular solute-binding protein [Pseudomonas sp. NPDC087342]|uniref:ABC transporter substrate-binding protein n=1 Tax=Pseudomonas sp. NPDC087342 TaxID=3364437 RepID=UPI0037F7C462
MKEPWSIDDIRNVIDGKPTRRQVLGGAAVLAGGAFMAPYFPVMAAEVGGKLRLLGWEGETFDDQLAEFVKSKKIDLKISSIANQDDVQIQLVGKTPTVIDITAYNEGYANYYGKQLKILSPLDESKLPNYSSDLIFDQFYKKPFWYWDDQLYGVVVAWGLNVLIYNPALVPEPKSYSDLLKPEYKGLLTFTDDILATWPMIARVTGFADKYPNLTKDELSKAFEAMEPYRAQSRVFAGSIGDTINLFVNKEIGVLFSGWTGITGETKLQGVETRLGNPVEGGAIWSDAFCIPKTAQNRDTAHAYINAVLTPEVQAANANKSGVATICKKAIPLLDEKARNAVNYDNLDEVFRNAPMQGVPPRVSDKYATFDQWIEAWENFKTGF